MSEKIQVFEKPRIIDKLYTKIEQLFPRSICSILILGSDFQNY